MPDGGLFDALKSGVLGIFQGPQDPRVPQGTGTRDSLIHAGLSTIASGSQDPMEAIAEGILAGREMGQAVQQLTVQQQQQAALASFLGEVGYDRDGLTSVFMRVLASGDLESAKAVSEVLKSLPDPKAETVTNRQRVSTVASAAAGTPAHILERFEEGTPIQVQQDPKTGQIFWDSVLPVQPPENPYSQTFVEPNDQSPTGAYRIGLRKDTGQREVIGLGPVPSSGGGGGAQQRINENLAEAMKQAQRDMAEVDGELSDPVVGALANMSNSRGPLGFMARGALSLFPKAQLAAGARERWVAPAVRLMSGAQMTESERQTYRVAYTTQPFDHPALQEKKTIARATLASLFAEDPDGLAALTGDQAKGILDQVLSEAGLGAPQAEHDPENAFGDLIPGRGGR